VLTRVCNVAAAALATSFDSPAPSHILAINNSASFFDGEPGRSLTAALTKWIHALRTSVVSSVVASPSFEASICTGACDQGQMMHAVQMQFNLNGNIVVIPGRSSLPVLHHAGTGNRRSTLVLLIFHLCPIEALGIPFMFGLPAVYRLQISACPATP